MTVCRLVEYPATRGPLRLAGMLNPRRVLMVHAKRQECAPLSSAPCRVRDEAR